MSEVINRDAIERKLARVLSGDLQTELEKLMNLLGDPPKMSNVPYEYWQNGWRSIQKNVEPILVDVFMGQAETMMTNIGVGVDWSMVNSTASNWSRQHGEEILKQLFDKTYNHVNELIPQFYEEGWTVDQLAARLVAGDYSPIRAQMIAITETTRASVEGERAVIEQLAKESGKRMEAVWKTNNDESVCEICGPLHNEIITNGDYPPAHPNCRCMVAWEWPKKDKE